MISIHRHAPLFGTVVMMLLFTLSAEAGTIAGRVTDAGTKLALSGARVSLAGNAEAAFTDQSGAFTLNGVPAGPQVIEFNYLGYSPIQQSAEVTETGITAVNAVFGAEVVQLEKFVIKGEAVGTARAINQQRAADALANIVASDAIGKFPDQNAAESLQRVPGLALYRDQGEGRYIIIRGINAQYNGISINGFRTATTERGSRNVPLDTVGSDSIAAMEVNKVSTPDKDADGLGGSVDIRTRSAFDANGRQAAISVSELHNDQLGRNGYNINGTYGDVFVDGRVGALLSASAQLRPFSSFNTEEGNGWSLRTSPTDGKQHWLFNRTELRHYEPTRYRSTVSPSFDFRVDPSLLISFRGTWANFGDREHRYATQIPFDANGAVLTDLTDTSASVTGVKGVQIRDRERRTDRHLSSGVLTFEKKLVDWRIDGGVGYSQAKEDRDALELRYDSQGLTNFSYAFTDPYVETIVATGGASITDPANFKYNSGNLTHQIGTEDQRTARINVRRDFKLASNPAYVKAGFQYRDVKKDQDAERVDITAVPFSNADVFMPDNIFPLLKGITLNPKYVNSFRANPTGFAYARNLSNSTLSDFTAKEDIGAAYAMGSVTVDKLIAIAGVRVEDTSFKITGQGLANGSTILTQTVKKDYTNWLPGVILRYNVTRDLVLRTSWTNTISRPPYEQTLLSRTQDDTRRTVAQGNPKLDPLKSVNWDASAEYYLPSLGLVSAGAFYKDITDFAYQTPAGLDPLTGYDLTTYVNGPKGHIYGIELAWQQQLRFLPAPFDGLGFQVNGTFSQSEATYPNRPGEKLPFVGQSKTIANFALTYEKSGFLVRVAANYRSPRLREDTALGTNVFSDRYVARFLQCDLSTSYRLNSNWQVFAEWINLNNEPFRAYFGGGGRDRIAQKEEYGYAINFGLRWNL